jgi:hypothetical protein
MKRHLLLQDQFSEKYASLNNIKHEEREKKWTKIKCTTILFDGHIDFELFSYYLMRISRVWTFNMQMRFLYE